MVSSYLLSEGFASTSLPPLVMLSRELVSDAFGGEEESVNQRGFILMPGELLQTELIERDYGIIVRHE